MTTKALPPTWTTVTLGDVGTWHGGGTPSKHKADYWDGAFLPWVSPKDMKTDRLYDAADHITETAVAESAAKQIDPPSVLVVTRSGILSHTLPVAVSEVAVAINQDLKAIRPFAGMSPDYLAWVMRRYAREILVSCSKHGTTVHSIVSSRLHDFVVPVAPVGEQRRIVEAIESYFTRLDDAVASLQRVQRNLKRYRASVLKAAVEGRLVPTEAELARREGRDYEPASELLKRILVERRKRWEEAELAKMKAKGKVPKDDRWKKKYKEPVETDTSELPVLPAGWCWATVDALTVCGAQNGLYVPRQEYGSGAPILRIDDYQVDWSRGASELKRVKVSPSIAAKYQLQLGELVVNRVNSPSHLGKVLVVEARHVPALFESNMMRLEMASAIESTFVCKYLNAEVGKARLTSNAKWAVNQASINQHDVARTPVPLPPAAEQTRICLEVSRLFSSIRDTNNTVEASRSRCGRLRQGILGWAFEGNLADQDPRDEPACNLLERIAGERKTKHLEPRRQVRNGQAAR